MPEVITPLSLHNKDLPETHPAAEFERLKRIEKAARRIKAMLDFAAAQGKSSRPIAPKLTPGGMREIHSLLITAFSK